MSSTVVYGAIVGNMGPASTMSAEVRVADFDSVAVWFGPNQQAGVFSNIEFRLAGSPSRIIGPGAVAPWTGEKVIPVGRRPVVDIAVGGIGTIKRVGVGIMSGIWDITNGGEFPIAQTTDSASSMMRVSSPPGGVRTLAGQDITQRTCVRGSAVDPTFQYLCGAKVYWTPGRQEIDGIQGIYTVQQCTAPQVANALGVCAQPATCLAPAVANAQGGCDCPTPRAGYKWSSFPGPAGPTCALQPVNSIGTISLDNRPKWGKAGWGATAAMMDLILAEGEEITGLEHVILSSGVIAQLRFTTTRGVRTLGWMPSNPTQVVFPAVKGPVGAVTLILETGGLTGFGLSPAGRVPASKAELLYGVGISSAAATQAGIMTGGFAPIMVPSLVVATPGFVQSTYAGKPVATATRQPIDTSFQTPKAFRVWGSGSTGITGITMLWGYSSCDAMDTTPGLTWSVGDGSGGPICRRVASGSVSADTICLPPLSVPAGKIWDAATCQLSAQVAQPLLPLPQPQTLPQLMPTPQPTLQPAPQPQLQPQPQPQPQPTPIVDQPQPQPTPIVDQPQPQPDTKPANISSEINSQPSITPSTMPGVMATTVSSQPVATQGYVGQPDPNVTYLGSLNPKPEPQIVGQTTGAGTVVVAPQDLTGQTITTQPGSSAGWAAFVIFVFCIILAIALYFVSHREVTESAVEATI